MSPEDAARLLGALNEETIRRIVECLREAANSRRQADDWVDPTVRAQMWTVLLSIKGNLERIETDTNSSRVREYARNMMAEAQNVDYQALFRKYLSRINQKSLDQHPDPGVPIIEEVPDSPRKILNKPGKGVGAVGKVIKDR